ncbi:BppU family phage baseplate upper protein [Bacillus paranthracis]|uniref:BppU family phage baseplate upper protein n=1 Tax=Bacillus TaxID=1386 RepID=UPI0012624B8B|nr:MULTISPECIES: BppU family phage baseplate upper protein [Bacillus]KAB7640582.1 DUF2479 domain-containing protein [Bacillus sp. B4-WWTP-NA-D-NA-NA]
MKTRLILDINKTQYAQLNSLVTGRVGDKASNTVDVYVVDGFIPYNLTGSDVYFECAKPDNTSVRDKNGITMIDAAKGHFEYTFPTQTFASVGKSKQAYFTVEKNSTVKATTQDFIIVSLPNALTNRIPSKTYISQLEELIWQLEQIQLDLLNSEAYREAHDAKEFAEQANELSINIQKQLNEIVINGDSSVEAAQARVDPNGITYPTLKERIDVDSNKIYNLFQFAPKDDTSLDDTVTIQNAINSASAINGTVKLSRNKTYIVKSLMPRENVTIDLNGSTLKLKDNTQLPVFFDYGVVKPIKLKNFSVVNGVIDANMQNNNTANQSSGVFWMTDWDGLLFDKLIIKNAFRNIFNLYGCHNIKIPSVLCDGNGQSNSGGFYSYGAAFETGCKNIEIGNFTVKNMYGFGIHFYKVENYTANNLVFDTLTHSTAIAITFTQSKRGKVNNISCKNIPGDNIEINACTDLEITNINIESAGRRPILFGDDNTGLYSERVKISNVTTTNTGATESLSVNFLKNSELTKCNFDKTLTTLANVLSENVRFVDCTFGGNMPSLAIYYNKFRFINTKFADTLIQRLENTIGEFGVVNNSVSVANGSVLNIPISRFEKSAGGSSAGRLCVVSTFSDNFSQTTYQEYAFVYFGTTLNITPIASVDGSFGRKITITGDGANKQFVLTNSTGVNLIVKWNVIIQ